jgi:DNA mismatch repair protein MutS2
MEVYVGSVAKTGRVQRVRADKVDVLLGRVVFTVTRSDLRIPPAAARPATAPPIHETTAHATPARLESTPRELLLLGKTVEEALGELDRFLDDAALAGHGEVRVIHGHGTGRLRRAVRDFLRRHTLVRGQRPGKPHEGGDGATVVLL